MSDMTFDGVTVNVERSDKSNFKLTVPLKDLNWSVNSKGQHQAEVSVFVVAFSSRKRQLGHFGTELVARASGDPAQSPDSLAGFAVPYTAPPGTARLRFVVRDAVSGKIGTVEIVNP
jgi:hypothetical protein